MAVQAFDTTGALTLSAMLLVIVAALVGAALGLFVRPRVFAVAIALALSGGVQQAIAFAGRLAAREPGQHVLVEQLDNLVGLDNDSVWPVLAAAGAGSIAAAVLWSLISKESTDLFWFPGDDSLDRRKRIKAMTGIEERAIHRQAESRFHELMDQ